MSGDLVGVNGYPEPGAIHPMSHLRSWETMPGTAVNLLTPFRHFNRTRTENLTENAMKHRRNH